MGLFSSLGKLAGFIPGVGPLVGAGLSAVGGAIDGKRERNAQRAQNAENAKYDAQRFIRLRKQATAGGFHPLEALRAGGASGESGPPRLATSFASQNLFDPLIDEVSGERARRENAQTVEDEIRRVERDRLKATTLGIQLENQRRARLPTGLAPNGTPPFIEDPTTRGTIGPDSPSKSRPDGYWSTDETIPVNLPVPNEHGSTLTKFPKRLAERLDVSPFDPIISDDLEAIAGDEISQVVFGDWLASNGLQMRKDGTIDKNESLSSGQVKQQVKDYFNRTPEGSSNRKQNR